MTTYFAVLNKVLSNVLSVLDPATKIFIPMYFVGSILGVISAVIRQAAFVIVLCSWFTLMNAIALVKLFFIG